jgi:hypothetical protein
MPKPNFVPGRAETEWGALCYSARGPDVLLVPDAALILAPADESIEGAAHV